MASVTEKTEPVEPDAQDWRSRISKDAEVDDLSDDLARAREPGRGREANTPEEIPSRGWSDILWRVVFALPEDRVLATAGGVAFFTLLAFFPAIAVVISLYGLFADVRTIGDHLALLAGILPEGALALIRDQIVAIVSKQTQTLSLAFLIGFATALWSANSGIGALFDALNVVYGENEKRSIVRFYATTFLFTIGAVLFVVAAIGAVVVLPVVLKLVGVSFSAEIVLSVIRWPIMLIVVVLGLSVVYRFGPSRANPQWRWVTVGSVGAAFLWIAASMTFSWYVASFDSYNRTYGSLGAGVGFMVWIWVSVVIVLIGAELNAEMEHQTAKDTTSGPEKPLGRRGAIMADRVGEAQG
jgi:membrane protein